MTEVSTKSEFFSLDIAEEIIKTLPQCKEDVAHFFAPGIYCRQLFIPKGVFILGKRHRHETMNILLSGKLQLHSGKDESDLIITAPMIFNSKPFVRKLAFALEDTLFLNIHPTEEKDLEKIEEEFIITKKEYSKLKEEERLCLGQQ